MKNAPYRILLFAIALLLGIGLLGITIRAWTVDLHLFTLNLGYRYMPSSWVKVFFTLYPFANVAILPVVIVQRLRPMFFPAAMILFGAYLCYILLPIIASECASCMCAGILPPLKLEHQLPIFSFFFILSVTGVFLPTRK